MRPSVRFEVFKRDDFTCVYCGRRTPAVVLEVDHILPSSKGGTDEIENLTTSCWDCNRGKGARTLESRAPIRDLTKEAELIQEREAQLLAWHDAQRQVRGRVDQAIEEVLAHWAKHWDGYSYYEPWPHMLRTYAEKLPLYDLLEAVDIALARRPHNVDSCRYFGGVVKRKLGRAEGSIVACTICGKDVFLAPEDSRTSSWHHTSCAEARK
jgi:hypothetical protein